jgi:hypothetical protein
MRRRPQCRPNTMYTSRGSVTQFRILSCSCAQRAAYSSESTHRALAQQYKLRPSGAPRMIAGAFEAWVP